LNKLLITICALLLFSKLSAQRSYIIKHSKDTEFVEVLVIDEYYRSVRVKVDKKKHNYKAKDYSKLCHLGVCYESIHSTFGWNFMLSAEIGELCVFYCPGNSERYVRKSSDPIGFALKSNIKDLKNFKPLKCNNTFDSLVKTYEKYGDVLECIQKYNKICSPVPQ
jgi:hypothetical protein